VAARPQSCDDLGMQHCAEAGTDWIGVQNKDAQRRAPFGDAAETVCPAPRWAPLPHSSSNSFISIPNSSSPIAESLRQLF
jgi:hypothetical protein